MLIKITSVISYLVILGLLVFLIMLLSESKSGGDAATKGIGRSMYLLIIAGIVFLLVFNLLSNPWLKYLGLALGLLCTAALVIILLALSGSSLVFQGPPKQDFNPEYEDPITTELFYAFQKGKVEQLKTLLKAHPNQVHEKQLLKNILYDIYYNDKDSARHLAALKYMLESDAKIDTSLTFYFIQMAYAGKADMTELLLQHGADANWIDENSKMPVILNTIVSFDYECKVIEVLIKYGADVNVKFYVKDWEDTFTPLSYAVLQEKWRCCTILLKNGADPNYKNKDGISIKEQILQKAESGQRNSQYSDLLQLVKQIKAL
jgi:Ankyrin repeats (3 copies)